MADTRDGVPHAVPAFMVFSTVARKKKSTQIDSQWTHGLLTVGFQMLDHDSFSM